MAGLHEFSCVDPAAQIGTGVTVGPYSVIGPDVVLKDGITVHSHVVITGNTLIGEECEIFPFAALGHTPQNLKYAGEKNYLEIGAHSQIREHVTMHPGTTGGGLYTKVGTHGLFMAGSHVAHDCHVGDHVIFANNATLGGHCIIGDHTILGGLCAVHQFVRIGEYAFVGGMSGVENDLIPYGMALGNRAHLSGLNIVGLKRQGFSREQVHDLRQAYRMLFAREGTLAERLEDVDRMFGKDAEVSKIIAFIKSKSDRALCVPKNGNS